MILQAPKPQSLKLFLLIFMITTFSYARTIKGIVYSKSDQLPIPGVSVRVMNTKIVTSTDFKGKFTIEINDKTAILEFSFLGFKSQQIIVNDNKFLKVI